MVHKITFFWLWPQQNSHKQLSSDISSDKKPKRSSFSFNDFEAFCWANSFLAVAYNHLIIQELNEKLPGIYPNFFLPLFCLVTGFHQAKKSNVLEFDWYQLSGKVFVCPTSSFSSLPNSSCNHKIQVACSVWIRNFCRIWRDDDDDIRADEALLHHS